MTEKVISITHILSPLICFRLYRFYLKKNEAIDNRFLRIEPSNTREIHNDGTASQEHQLATTVELAPLPLSLMPTISEEWA